MQYVSEVRRAEEAEASVAVLRRERTALKHKLASAAITLVDLRVSNADTANSMRLLKVCRAVSGLGVGTCTRREQFRTDAWVWRSRKHKSAP